MYKSIKLCTLYFVDLLNRIVLFVNLKKIYKSWKLEKIKEK